MKRLLCAILFLLLLCGCGKESPAVTDHPGGMTVEYGESGVEAASFGYQWRWKENGAIQHTAADAVDPLENISEIPYVNQSKDRELKLVFDREPEALGIRYWTNTDGYTEPVTAQIDGFILPAPLDEASYLFEITAVWEEAEDAVCWGEAVYCFRYLPQGATGKTEDLSLYRLLKLTAGDLFGVEFISNVDGASRTCRSVADKEAILHFLQNNLATEFVQTQVPTVEMDYVLRLAQIDGSQLTMGYAQRDGAAWILLGGVPYEAGVMDLASLWSSLEAEMVLQTQAPSGEYLQVTEEYPAEQWGSEFVYGFLHTLENQVVFDQVFWIEEDSGSGYRLEAGEAGRSLPVAADCQFWILEDHWSPCCQVTKQTLLDWENSAGFDILFRLYVQDGEVIAICEQYRP